MPRRRCDVWHGMGTSTLLAQALTSSFGLPFLSQLFQFDSTLQNDKKEKSRVNCLELGSGLGWVSVVHHRRMSSYHVANLVVQKLSVQTFF